jgi:hypothetical protein
MAALTSDNMLTQSLFLTFRRTLSIFSYVFFIFLKVLTQCDGIESTFNKLIMVCVCVCCVCVYTYIWKEFWKYSIKCWFICTTYAHAHTHTHIHICVCVCMCECMYVHVCLYIIHVHEWMNVCDVFSADTWISKHHFIFNRIPIFWHFIVLDICGSQDSCLETIAI